MSVNENELEPATTVAPQVINLMLQGKGGVGKSLVASFLAQFYASSGQVVKCIDTDPVNQTFSQYTGIGAQHLRLMDGNQVNRRHFDELIDDILATHESFVVDNGDRHYKQLFGFAVLTSMFEAALAITQNRQQSILVHPSATQEAESAAGREVSQLGTQITRKNLNVQPTVKIPVGYKFQCPGEPRYLVRVTLSACSG
jgi:hypothetical protein